ncbi:MAG: hypothetical protein MRZ91_03545 [Christensenellaceae bacterium]|nr:hypothetical protein [Christensenellaceae bacterium]MDD6926543.1 hypothetical protein [bacterium]
MKTIATKKAFFALTIIYLFLLCADLTYLPVCLSNAETIYSLSVAEAEEILSSEKAVYARVNDKKADFYSDAELTEKIFTLPYTYFLSVKEISGEVCRAVYCYEDYDYARGVYGYVKVSDVLFQTEPPSGKSFPNVFPKKEGSGTFYKNAEFTKYYSASETEGLTDPFFYGYYTRSSGGRYCYVLCGGKFGYYSAEVFEEINVPPHSDAMPVEKPLPEPQSETGDEKENFLSSDTNKVILISVLCVIAVIAMYVIFLPKSKTLKRTDDEED